MEKKTVKKTTKKTPILAEKKTHKYFEGIGRRKTSSARVRIFPSGAEKEIIVNGKTLEKYFPVNEMRQNVLFVLQKMDLLGKMGISVKVVGGGLNSQSEAIRHGIANALVLFDPENRRQLKSGGFLTRDSRMRERKKFGLKRARRAPQWAKR